MSTVHPATRAIRVACAACAAVITATSQAATWYVAGNFDDFNCGAALPAPLKRAYPSGTSFSGEFTFDPAAPALPIYDGRDDFVTTSGGSTTVHTKRYTLHTGSSRMITMSYLDGTGAVHQSLALNGNEPATGAHHPVYGDPGVDLVEMSGLPGVTWFALGQMPASPPALTDAQSPPCLQIFYTDPKTGGSYQRLGNVTYFSTVPPSAATR